MAKIVTDKGEVCLFRFDVPDPGYGFNSLVVGNIAAKAVNRIGRVDDESAFTQHIHYLFNGFFVWVFGVDLYQHNYKANISRIGFNR